MSLFERFSGACASALESWNSKPISHRAKRYVQLAVLANVPIFAYQNTPSKFFAKMFAKTALSKEELTVGASVSLLNTYLIFLLLVALFYYWFFVHGSGIFGRYCGKIFGEVNDE